MFELTIHDREGEQVNLGDLIRLESHRQGSTVFYARLTWDAEAGLLRPLHTFSWHSFVKVDKLPEDVIEGTDGVITYWADKAVAEDTGDWERFKRNLMSWRDCERKLSDGVFRITPVKALSHE